MDDLATLSSRCVQALRAYRRKYAGVGLECYDTDCPLGGGTFAHTARCQAVGLVLAQLHAAGISGEVGDEQAD